MQNGKNIRPNYNTDPTTRTSKENQKTQTKKGNYVEEVAQSSLFENPDKGPKLTTDGTDVDKKEPKKERLKLLVNAELNEKVLRKANPKQETKDIVLIARNEEEIVTCIPKTVGELLEFLDYHSNAHAIGLTINHHIHLSFCTRFEEKESVSGIQQLKSSVQKGIRTKLLDIYPHLDGYVDTILPKKDTYRIVKCHDHIEILVNSTGELLFFRHREGPWVPTLRLLHKYPFILPWEQVDKGAIRFVLSGANIMCPGLTSPGAKMTSVPKGTVVVSFTE
uniref:Pre-PUA domain-containing protein n=1 Tax=Timema bartmani TaxID=61472 RepID=A0A7R9F108_9NEOP|nr:unnamed protein product [Timema bartmani]